MPTHAVVEVDADGIVRRWSDGAVALFGWTSDVALGRPVDLMIPPGLRSAHWSGFHRAMRAPKIKDLAADLPVHCADGRDRIFAGRLLVLSDALGVALGAIAVFVDEGSTGRRPFG